MRLLVFEFSAVLSQSSLFCCACETGIIQQKINRDNNIVFMSKINLRHNVTSNSIEMQYKKIDLVFKIMKMDKRWKLIFKSHVLFVLKY